MARAPGMPRDGCDDTRRRRRHCSPNPPQLDRGLRVDFRTKERTILRWSKEKRICGSSQPARRCSPSRSWEPRTVTRRIKVWLLVWRTNRFFASTRACIGGTTTPLCICRCGMSSADSTNPASSSPSTNPVMSGALRAGGHPDYTLIVLPRGNHLQFEARVGSNAEMPSLQRIVPAYFSTVQAWLAKTIRGLDATAAQ